MNNEELSFSYLETSGYVIRFVDYVFAQVHNEMEEQPSQAKSELGKHGERLLMA